jgi:predicted transcriptional regulator
VRNRGRTEIVVRILGSAINNDGTTLRGINYEAYLGHVLFEERLAIVTENDLLRRDTDAQPFKTTEKDLRLVKIYNEAGKLFNGEQQQQQHTNTMINEIMQS